MARTGASDAWRPRSGSGLGRRRVELAGLVVNLNSDLAELVAVRSGVVAAEEEIASTCKNNPYVRLRAAAVTTIGCIENWNR
jgi:hypothetical protein